MDRIEADVLVAGGGVAGLTAAAAFATAGFRVVCVDPVPPVTSAEAEGSDLRSTAFLHAGGGAPRACRALGPARPRGGAAPGHADRRRRRRRGRDPRDGGLRGARARRRGLRLEPAELAAPPRDGGAARRAAGGGAARRRAGRAGDAAHRRGAGGAVGRHPGARGAGRGGRRPRQRGARGARHRGRGAGATARRPWSSPSTHPLPHDGVSTEIHRSGGPFTLVPLPTATARRPRPWSGWRTGPRAAELAAMPVGRLRGGAERAELRRARPRSASRARGGSGRSSPRWRRGSTGRARRWWPRPRTSCRRSGRRGST